MPSTYELWSINILSSSNLITVSLGSVNLLSSKKGSKSTTHTGFKQIVIQNRKPKKCAGHSEFDR